MHFIITHHTAALSTYVYVCVCVRVRVCVCETFELRGLIASLACVSVRACVMGDGAIKAALPQSEQQVIQEKLLTDRAASTLQVSFHEGLE